MTSGRISIRHGFKLNFDERQKLIGFGFEDQDITQKMIAGVFSRAGAIVEEANAQDCGTIVVGRNGVSSVQDFFIGRVSNKIIPA